MKIALCCIGKLENKYIKEYVDYYKILEVDKIFLYDNNDKDGEHFEEVLQNDIDDGFVELIDFRGKKRCQLLAYSDCYDKHKNEYDWIAFFDCDEFLTFGKYGSSYHTIKEYLSDKIFDKYNMIHINWMCYGDNGLIGNESDDTSVLKRFTTPVLPYDFKRSLRTSENNHIKSIVRGYLPKINWCGTPHTPSNEISCCNNIGETINSTKPFSKFNFDLAYLKHFTTKSCIEYKVKIERGFPDHIVTLKEKNEMAERYFKYNEMTDEKLEILGIKSKDSINEEKQKFVRVIGKKEEITNQTEEKEDTNGNVNIYVCAHKNFEVFPNNSAYTIVHGSEEITVPLKQVQEQDVDDSLLKKQQLYGEGSRMYWVWKHEKLKKYVGFCHYSKYFDFYDNVPDMDEIFKEHDVILTSPLNVYKVYNQYENCHNIEDLKLISLIIKGTKQEYFKSFINTMFDGELYPCNMFIMKKEDFIEYCEFVFDVLSTFDNIRDFKTYKDAENYVLSKKDLYLKHFYPNNQITYQARIDGFILERLTNAFVKHKFKNPMIYPIKTTDNKYNKNLFKHE